MPRVTELWAWVMEDSAPDDEGVPAYYEPAVGTMMPLMGADEARARSLRPQAEKIAGVVGRPIRLVRSVGELEEVDVVRPYPRGQG